MNQAIKPSESNQSISQHEADNIIIDSLNDQTEASIKEEKSIIESKLSELNKTVMEKLFKSKLKFSENTKKMDVTAIGEISYGDQFDLLLKVKQLNNPASMIKAEMSSLVSFNNIVRKRYGLLSRNKIVVMFERYFGQVSFMYINVVYIDGTVLCTNQLSGLWSFYTSCIYNNHILIALRCRKDQFKIYLYNDKLELVIVL